MTLLAAYNFDEASGNPLDVTGNGHPLTLNSGTRTTGHTNTGLSCTDGSEGTTIRPYCNATFGQTANRTVMCWFKYTSVPGGKWIMEFHNAAGDTGTWGIILGLVGGQASLRARNASTAVNCSATLPGANAWHHYAGTYDGSTLRLYIDGTLANSAALSGPLRTDADYFWLLNGSQASDVIDDVRVYDQVLDQATIASLMNTPVAAGTTTVGVNGSAAWNVRAKAAKTGGAAWNTRALAGVNGAAAWNTRIRVATSGGATWQVRSLARVDGASAWNVRSLAHLDGTAGWAVRRTTGVDGAAAWAVRTRARTDGEASWVVRALAGVDGTARWRVLVVARVDGTVAWQVRQLAGADGAAGWDVEAPPGVAGVNGAAAWTVRALARADGQSAWAVRGITRVDGAAAWRGRALAGAFGAAAWAVRVFAAVTGRAAWDVHGEEAPTPEPLSATVDALVVCATVDTLTLTATVDGG